MFAIIETGGKQYKVSKGDRIVVEKLPGEVGCELVIDKILAIGGDVIKIGAPFVNGAKVMTKISEHFRDKKLLVFKKRRRKNSRRKNGHRQSLTVLNILEIIS